MRIVKRFKPKKTQTLVFKCLWTKNALNVIKMTGTIQK